MISRGLWVFTYVEFLCVVDNSRPGPGGEDTDEDEAHPAWAFG